MSFKALIYGEAGVGKTYSIHTLLNAGQKVRFLAAENNAISGIKIAMKEHHPEITPEQFGLMIPARPKRTMADLVKAQTMFVQLPLESQFKSVDPNKKNFTRYLEVLKATVDFQDTATGTKYGCIDDWGEDVTLAVDSMTIICEAIISATIGGKLTMSLPEWGTVQKVLVEFLRQLTEDLKCNLVILGHPVKEIDPIAGTQRVYPANLGQALNNLLPTIFTDVMYAERKKKEFTWSTMHPLAVTRTTHIPIAEKMPQDFMQFFKK